MEQVNLREHFEKLLDERNKLNDARFSAIEKAQILGVLELKETMSLSLDAAKISVLKAEDAAEKRFNSVNEFRAVLTEQQKTLATKNELQTDSAFINKRVDEIAIQVDKLRLAQSESIGKTIVQDPAIAIAIKGLQEQVASLVQTRSLLDRTVPPWGLIAGFIAVIIVVLTLVFKFT